MAYQRRSALTASSYNKIYRQNPPTTKAWNVDTVLKKRSQSQRGTAIHNFIYTVLKVRCFQRHSQLLPHTSLEDNHLFFTLHPTTYTTT